MTTSIHSTSRPSAKENLEYFLPESQKNAKIQQHPLTITTDLTSKDILSASCQEMILFRRSNQSIAIRFTVIIRSKVRIYENIYNVFQNSIEDRYLKGHVKRPNVIKDKILVTIDLRNIKFLPRNILGVSFQEMISKKSEDRIRSLTFTVIILSKEQIYENVGLNFQKAMKNQHVDMSTKRNVNQVHSIAISKTAEDSFRQEPEDEEMNSFPIYEELKPVYENLKVENEKPPINLEALYRIIHRNAGISDQCIEESKYEKIGDPIYEKIKDSENLKVEKEKPSINLEALPKRVIVNTDHTVASKNPIKSFINIIIRFFNKKYKNNHNNSILIGTSQNYVFNKNSNYLNDKENLDEIPNLKRCSEDSVYEVPLNYAEPIYLKM